MHCFTVIILNISTLTRTNITCQGCWNLYYILSTFGSKLQRFEPSIFALNFNASFVTQIAGFNSILKECSVVIHTTYICPAHLCFTNVAQKN